MAGMSYTNSMPALKSVFSIALGKASLKRPSADIRVSPALIEAALSPRDAVLQKQVSSLSGLEVQEASKRLERYGANAVAMEQRAGWMGLLYKALFNPLVILLSCLAAVSFLTGDSRAGITMFIMVFLSVSLRFQQEMRADAAAAKLKAMINVTATVIREGHPMEVPLSNLVPGDIVSLSAGDMIPADVRILSSKDLFVTQAALTGESLPVEKYETCTRQDFKSPLEMDNICFLGTNVESGSATGIVIATGRNTYLGQMAGLMTIPPAQTSFDKGINRFTWLMIRFMAVMVPTVFLLNGWTKHDWTGAFFFAVAVAVGLTPEMLPMIVTVCLSKGALVMSRKKVIVKRLNSIQNFGAMDILCTDKTGTLTQDHVVLERHCDVVQKEDESVLELAYLNSYFQTGLKNILDRAVLAHKEVHQELSIPEYQKVDEIPFDFSRKIMSVIVQMPGGGHRLICKGAPEEVFLRSSQFELDGEIYPVERVLLEDLKEEYQQLSADGFRVLALAYKDSGTKSTFSKEDEKDLILKGYVAFFDPPKETAAPAIRALCSHGVTVKVLTGDNELVSKKICGDVGLASDQILMGHQIEGMIDEELKERAEIITVFARLSPVHKQRIILALQQKGHVVGFMGDGINDAPALRAADVGISVDTAVDIAKESADLILLEKSLLVLEEGVLEGRKVFANILKYVRMGASSNFGNMFSVLGASAFLPFLPMAPIQILTNNLLYDFSQIAIPTDNVDPDQIAKPCPWSMKEISRFIFCIGPISSIFDYLTFFVMFYVFNCRHPASASLFQTGWFVESLLTQTLIIHVIRTDRIPFIQSRASWPLSLTSLSIMAIGVILPFSPLAHALGLSKLPNLYWPILAGILLGYIALTQSIKTWLLGKMWI